MSLVFPRVCNNSNTKAQLIDELRDVHDKLTAAIEALSKAQYANGRNYQTLQDMNAAHLAREQHSHRLIDLNRIKQELMEIAMEIDSQ